MKMKKWIIAGILALCGVVIFVITSCMVGRFDKWQIAEAQAQGVSGGQFNGAGQEILHLMFFWFLAAIVIVGLIIVGISFLIKWRGIALARTSYGSLYYWCGIVPVVAYLVGFPTWALWLTLKDCMKYIK